MKKQYWFIILLAVWCLASAWWYLFGVKGVKTDPQFFSPAATLISIIEIVAMLLVACLIGYAIAWWLRGESLEEHEEVHEKLLSNNASLHRSNEEIKSQYELLRNKYQQDIGYSRQKIQEVTTEHKRDQTAVEELKSQVELWKGRHHEAISESQQAIDERNKLQRQLDEKELSFSTKQQDSLSSQAELEKLESEAGTLRYRIRQLEFQNKEHEESYAKLRHELETLQAQRNERSTFSEHPFVRPVEPSEKDNLTEIKGIGPFIEKRLNMLGIYTFKQLSELTPELVERVGNAIEFFPGRIERENWIGQARNFIRS